MSEEGDKLALRAEVLDPSDIEKRANAELDRVQDRLYEESSGIVRATMRFADFDFFDENDQEIHSPPDSLVEECGGDRDEAARIFRIAKAASLPASKAPAGLKLAANVYTGILASKAAQKQTHVSLGIHVLQPPEMESPPIKRIPKKAGS